MQKVIEKINTSHARWKDPEDKEMTKDRFELLCKVCGRNYTPASVILNSRFNLDVPKLVMFDWAHLYVHDGLADVELGLCMKEFHCSR